MNEHDLKLIEEAQGYEPEHWYSVIRLIEQAESRLEWMEKNYPLNTTMKPWTKTHNLECQRTLVRLLKKCKREKQTNMFEAFENMK